MSLCKQCEYWVGNGATPNISKIVCMVPEDYKDECKSFKRVKNTQPAQEPKEEPITITVESCLEYEDEEGNWHCRCWII